MSWRSAETPTTLHHDRFRGSASSAAPSTARAVHAYANLIGRGRTLLPRRTAIAVHPTTAIDARLRHGVTDFAAHDVATVAVHQALGDNIVVHAVVGVALEWIHDA